MGEVVGEAVAAGRSVTVGIWVGVGAVVGEDVGAGAVVAVGLATAVAGAVGSGISVGAGAVVEVDSGAVVGISVGRGVPTTVGSWVGFAGFVGSGWLTDGAVASGSGVSVGETTAVGDGFEQAARVRMTSSIAASSAFVIGWDLRSCLCAGRYCTGCRPLR